MVKDNWVSIDMSQYWNKKCVKLSFTSTFSKKPTVFSLLFCAKGDISWGPNFKRVELFLSSIWYLTLKQYLLHEYAACQHVIQHIWYSRQMNITYSFNFGFFLTTSYTLQNYSLIEQWKIIIPIHFLHFWCH